MEKEKCMQVSNSSPMHAVMVPFFDQGHLKPMLHLALRLVSRGAIVTFVCTQRDLQDRLMVEYSSVDSLRFVAIRNDRPPEIDQPFSLDVEASVQGPISKPPVFDRGPVEAQQAAALESLIRSGFQAGNGAGGAGRASCLISDSFLPWTRDVARKCDVKWLVLWAACATWLCISIYAAEELESKDPQACDHMELNIPGLPFVKDHAAAFLSSDFPKPHLTHTKELIKTADCIIVNTSDHLEKEALLSLPSSFPVLTVGPLFYGLTENLKNEDAACFSWLDKQEQRSVVYIAFGSKVLLQEQLLEQLALGIEASGKPFLWVIRCKEPNQQQLEGFMKDFQLRTQGRGLIVSWASQVRVLQHPAIGAFVTHCGWNSVLESIAMGVPMVCCPLFTDQFTNRVLVEQHWRVGRGIPMTKMQANGVLSLIKDVIEDEDMRHRAIGLSHSTQLAMQHGASSYQHLDALMQCHF